EGQLKASKPTAIPLHLAVAIAAATAIGDYNIGLETVFLAVTNGFWLLGSFGRVRWADFHLLLVVVLVSLAICIWMARALDAFTFGDEDAAALGVPVARIRLLLFGVTAMMTATIVSMVGAIGFVGPVVPHAARYVVGPMHLKLLPACAVVGAVFMAVADIVSRVIVAQQTIPIGVVTALVGVPFFAVILYRARPQA
ncbi:FecCD family ABC transporter permease, partial [Palleronia sp.]|uniref:FecCD family ABC transporter permease n=1 Tax=Palleronia sp. TaxID=1940284 RepID=UPI0035C78C65